MGLKLSVNIESLEEFYREADHVEATGDMELWKQHDRDVDEIWVGLDRETILKSKFSYKEGLDKLKQIEGDMNLGGTKKRYKYDEFDGDDMNYDRFLEQLPSLKKRIKTLGPGHGRFINLHVCICENSWCSARAFMTRAYTAMRIIDYLESLGYRIGVYVYTDTDDMGHYKGQHVDEFHMEVCVKRPEEPLLKPLILTAVSPWTFRYWGFKFRCAKFNPHHYMGASATRQYENTKTDLYIKRGECLSTDDSNRYVKYLVEKQEEQL